MTIYPDRIPEFPWDSLLEVRKIAALHPDGVVDISVGTPVDSTPEVIQSALRLASDAPGYPTTVGMTELREAIVNWFSRRRGVNKISVDNVLPTIGSKEAVAMLPAMLGLGEGKIVLHPECAYPTYAVGAQIAGIKPIPVGDDPKTWPTHNVGIVWLNSPGNPHGHVLSRHQLQQIVTWSRTHGVVVASDECYAELPWTEPYISEGIPSLLDKDVAGDDYTNLLVLYSLSKQSCIAGYRAAFMAGDDSLIASLIELRKHCGFMVPAPVQYAMVAALTDQQHVDEVYKTYKRRREILQTALHKAGYVTDSNTQAGLYLWVSDGESSAKELCFKFAELGIVCAPGTFYGEKGRGYVRIGLTAPDERIESAAERLLA